MKSQNFKKRSSSYNITKQTKKSQESDKDKRTKWSLRALFGSSLEPELKQFVLEGWDGEKKRSMNYRSGWDVDDHRITLPELAARYNTNLENGLSSRNVPINRATFGVNELTPPKTKSNLVRYLENLLLGLNLLLWVCGAVTLVTGIYQSFHHDLDDAIGNYYSGVSLLVVVLVAGTFSFYQEFQSNKAMDSFKKMAPQCVNVIRDGQRSQINSSDLVVGDIVDISYGEKLPADVRILACQSFKVDNSAITGESEAQSRGTLCTNKEPMETRNLAFFSTSVVQGNARGLVIRVGSSTLLGRIAKLAATQPPTKSPLAKEMSRLIRVLTALSLLFGVVFYFLSLSMGYGWEAALFFVIGIVVGNVPENLSVTLTIVLALAAKRLAKKSCLVKQLQAVETLGSASVICSDKTGTLTQNRMSLAHLYSSGRLFSTDDLKGRGSHEFTTFEPLLKIAALCSRARFKPGQENVPLAKREVEGDSSEAGILKGIQGILQEDVECFRGRFENVFEIPFNSVNKFQVSIHREKGDARLFLAMKGAPERILDLCGLALVESSEVGMDFDVKAKINEEYLRLASLGERVLGFCDAILPIENDYEFTEENFDMKDIALRFVGFISLIDPPRPTVPDAVLKCKSAGVKVAMITGDHPATAVAIARAVNIITSDVVDSHNLIKLEKPSLPLQIEEKNKAAVFTGRDLSTLSEEELRLYIAYYDELVFARTSPEQKYDIVRAYQKLGHVVAVTGDGVNDAPALKRADIGIAIGSGTEVAREVADFVLLDDNFASIVGGIEDGRLIFENLKKLIRYTMADNVAEMYCYWVYIIFRLPLPIGTIGMLLSTLGADIFPAVSLAHEAAESDIMKLQPRNPELEPLMTPAMLSYSYGQVASIETLSGFLAYFVTFAVEGWFPPDLIQRQRAFDNEVINDLEDSYGQEWTFVARQQLGKQAQTAFFLAIVISQFANAVSCKTRRASVFQNGMRNKFMNVGLVLMILVPCIFIYTPGLNTAVSFEPLRIYSWLACLPFAILLFIYDESRKFLIRTRWSRWISSEFSV